MSRLAEIDIEARCSDPTELIQTIRDANEDELYERMHHCQQKICASSFRQSMDEFSVWRTAKSVLNAGCGLGVFSKKHLETLFSSKSFHDVDLQGSHNQTVNTIANKTGFIYESNGKHGWNSRENYFDIHFKVLRFLEPYMLPPVQYKREVVTDRYEILEAPKIVFTTWNRHTLVHASIRKDITIRRRPGAKPEAKTHSYRYHANLPDGRALMRYCRPDDPSMKVDPKNHHTFHHKHVFDHLGNEVKVVDVQNRAEEWLHVSDFLNELLSTF